MAQIVCISYIPWRSAPSRSQELLSHIPEAEVLFFQPASSRRADAAAGRQVLPNKIGRASCRERVSSPV